MKTIPLSAELDVAEGVRSRPAMVGFYFRCLASRARRVERERAGCPSRLIDRAGLGDVDLAGDGHHLKRHARERNRLRVRDGALKQLGRLTPKWTARQFDGGGPGQ